jgi:hypothetical protein
MPSTGRDVISAGQRGSFSAMIADWMVCTTDNVIARTQPAIMVWSTSQNSWITP